MKNDYRMWDEIIYPFPNFNDVIVEVCEWIIKYITHFTGHVITYVRIKVKSS